MNPKQIEITCPCCDTRITVDVLTGTVLRHAPPTRLDETGKPIVDPARWDEATERVRGRSVQSQDKFEDALGREKRREADLDDLFERAKRKARGGPAEGRPEPESEG